MKKYYVYFQYKASDHSLFYIGKGNGLRNVDPKQRNKHWKNIVAKYGFYSKIVFESFDENEVFRMERRLIRTMKKHGVNLCNIAPGGLGGRGFTHTEESKRKISEALMNRVRKASTYEKLSAALTGQKRKFKYKKRRPQLHGNKRAVVCVETNIQYESAALASRELGLNNSLILAVCKGTRNHTGGLTFKYMEIL